MALNLRTLKPSDLSRLPTLIDTADGQAEFRVALITFLRPPLVDDDEAERDLVAVTARQLSRSGVLDRACRSGLHVDVHEVDPERLSAFLSELPDDTGTHLFAEPRQRLAGAS
ncbi:hypothetical protein [Polymorphum gilvum]|uniref:Uncharacterized protein n=1 Tax=Polymorphum gilvum (strain LMG 25793 / CGMCC 1.9160 / SL003B-26A1) TaxID=991905 RepID=F2J4D5_POLGS|nr:hypothetical protein [Polymorphum gilvum]ADZ71077.1 hypothetical protein SL003B_2654 [Polymorphum gilvum SL003B-26A1]